MLITSFSASAQDNKAIKDSNLLKKTANSKDSIHAKPAKSVLDAKVDYHAKDSMRLDAANRKVYLYGDAEVKYQDLELKAAYIEISMDSNIAFATGIKSDSGKMKGEPEFHQGNDIFYAQTMRYNFKSKKGRLSQIRTKEGEGYIHGETVKKDSTSVYYIKNGKYTTCDLEADPHFYIAATKLKVIPHDEVITGPAYMVIEGIPTPLAIPFGFFPLYSGRHSGIIMPTYGSSEEQGYFLSDGGYYFGLSDHLDMQLKGTIYSFGSWGLKDIIDYSDRYHFAGNFSAAYADTKLPIPNTSKYSDSRNFFVTWAFIQDPKARPNSTFSASVNAGTSNYFTYNSYNPTTFLQNTFQSNIAYTKNFPQTPFHLSLNAEHSQNTINHTVEISLPEVTLTADRMYPARWFEANPELHNSKWYNNISVGLSSNAANRINTYDSLLFRPQTLRQMQNGVNTSIPITGSFHIFRYITFTPLVNVSSITYFQTIRENFNSVRDSIETDTVHGVKTATTYNASATLTTNVYGMYSLGIKNPVLFRQVFYPSIGFSYHPDYSSPHYGFYQSVRYNNENANTELYSIFKNGMYGGPGIGPSGALQMSLGTNLEMKLRKRTDTGYTSKKVVLIERFALSNAYNFLADSFKWSTISLTGNTTLFKKLAINFSGNIDPYRKTLSGSRDSNSIVWGNTPSFTLGRLTTADLSFSTTLAPAQKQQTQNKSGTGTTSNQPATNTGPVQFTSPDQYMYYEAMHPDFYAPLELTGWSLTLFYNILYSEGYTAPGQKNITQSLTINGSAQVTKYWYMSIYTGYDFVGKQFTTTSFSARRDMHCWELAFTTVPFGFHQSFSVDVHVKASVLKDLKLTRKRDWVDTQQFGQ